MSESPLVAGKPESRKRKSILSQRLDSMIEEKEQLLKTMDWQSETNLED